MTQTPLSDTFSTGNLALATSLLTAGFRLVDPERPCTIVYTPELLQRAGCKTVSDAVSRNVRGIVQFHFKRSDGLREAILSYDAGVGSTGEGGINIEHATAPEVACIAAVALQNRRWLNDAWRHMDPLIRVGSNGRFALINKRTPKRAIEDWGVKP